MPRKIARYGWKPDLPDHRDRIFNNEEIVLTDAQLPAKYSLRDSMPPVYDQGQLGSCTANAIAGCLEADQIKQGEKPATPSRLFIYYNERVAEGTVEEDSGAEIRTGIKSVHREGAPPEHYWPYHIEKFADKPSKVAYEQGLHHEAITYKRVVPGTPGSPIRTPLFTKGVPVTFGFSVPAYFEEEDRWNPATDPLPVPGPDDEFIGGHAVDIVGWDFTHSKPFFEVRNSWAESWGDEGYFYMDAQWFWNRSLGLTSDFWTILRVS